MSETSMIDQVVNAVVDTINKEYVQVEVSARHVHLSQKDLETLFGPGATLTPKRELSQPGQYLSEQRVTLVGPKGRKENVSVLGPVRKATQVELSKSDA
ncbi:MAG: propanediol utilization protein, partial [Firmicutes bacterium]|nr:propanediol utilization protein [Bacillota bacterium]